MKVKKAAKSTGKSAAASTPIVAKERKSSRLSVHGKTVCVSGTIAGMTRQEVQSKLEGLGARVTSAVSKQTDYLFAAADAGSKRADAERLGIPVLSDTVLVSLIGAPPGKPKSAKVSAAAKAKVAERAPDSDDGFAGKTVVITGTLSRQRSDIAATLTAAGAKVTGSVSANTHYLIAGAGVGATKLSKATALGVKVIDEATMDEMLG